MGTLVPRNLTSRSCPNSSDNLKYRTNLSDCATRHRVGTGGFIKSDNCEKLDSRALVSWMARFVTGIHR